MIAFLEKLTQRRTEVARKGASEWQALVIAIADGKTLDPDEALIALDRLGKSTDDLAKGVGLLNQRRAWSALVAAGVKAESDYPLITKKIEAEVAAFKALEEKHEATLWPLTTAKTAAAQSITEAAQARRELQRTASDPLRLQAVADADAAMVELRREKADHVARLKVKVDALRKYSEWPDQFTDVAATITRLQGEVAAMEIESLAFDTRAEKLNTEAATTRKQLESPEAI